MASAAAAHSTNGRALRAIVAPVGRDRLGPLHQYHQLGQQMHQQQQMQSPLSLEASAVGGRLPLAAGVAAPHSPHSVLVDSSAGPASNRAPSTSLEDDSTITSVSGDFEEVEVDKDQLLEEGEVPLTSKRKSSVGSLSAAGDSLLQRRRRRRGRSSVQQQQSPTAEAGVRSAIKPPPPATQLAASVGCGNDEQAHLEQVYRQDVRSGSVGQPIFRQPPPHDRIQPTTASPHPLPSAAVIPTSLNRRQQHQQQASLQFRPSYASAGGVVSTVTAATGVRLDSLTASLSDALPECRRRAKIVSMRVMMQSKVYNFLERPTGWKCFAYHFSV